MPQISLLTPTVLNGFVREKPFPQSLLGLSLVGRRRPYPFPNFSYEIVKGNNRMSKPNVPNSEAHIRGVGNFRSIAGSFIYMRDKKPFEATTLYWLREPGGEARQNAEAAVAREVADLDDGIERFVEWTIWQMVMNGKLQVYRPDAPRVEVDYKFPATHVVNASVPWTTTATAKPIDDVRGWKQLIISDTGGFVPNRAFLNTTTFGYLIQTAQVAALYSDRMKEEYLRTMTVKGLLGFDWTIYDNEYVDDWTSPGTETSTKYIPNGKIVFGSLDGDPMGIWEGLSSDHEALQANRNYTGKFTKQWVEKDPSTRIVLEEYPFIPVMQRPDNFIIADVD